MKNSKMTFKSVFSLFSVLSVSAGIWHYSNQNSLDLIPSEPEYKPVVREDNDDRDEAEHQKHQLAKVAPWSAEDAARHQELLKRYMKPAQPGPTPPPGAANSFANGKLFGSWANRGAYNMPGAFKFTEMLDGTDTIYGVTHNHYAAEYNSKSYIFKGTVYNPNSGTQGDDFVRLTGHWPNRYQDLVVIKYNSKTRLIAAIEAGPLYYSDDDGATWTQSTGLPSSLKSTIVNRQDDNKIYTTNGQTVYRSTDGGASFSSFQNFGSSSEARLYSPRYASQPNASDVYLARGGTFYKLTSGGSSFISQGSFAGSQNSTSSIAGDSRKLYMVSGSSYYVSTNGGSNWTQRYPKGNWYGDRSGTMSAGKYLGVHPGNPDTVIAGYAQPVYSHDGLLSDISTDAGWGRYQNGTGLSKSAYFDRIRYNYHPDIQASQFYYNSTGELFSIISTDGGLFQSFKSWTEASNSSAPNNTASRASATHINITLEGTTCALIYRSNLFTGSQDETHYYYSTQDQGTQNTIDGESGVSLSVHQSIGGDGPPLKSANGNHVWKWQRRGEQVWAPVTIYDGSNNRRSAGTINGMFNSQPTITLSGNTHVGWINTFIDKDEGDKRMWLLTRNLERIEYNGSSLSKTTISKGTGNQVSAMAQGVNNPDVVYFLQEAKVYKSTNRGDTFNSGTSTPMSKTTNYSGRADIGGGWVLPGNDNWVLFAGPSNNSVGSVLSKDGGTTWTDVTGNFPSGADAQVGGMVGTPDGKYVFAGTDIGPWVFIVEEETWYPIGDGAANFNTTDIEYIASTNSVRFGTWGSGVWDFKVEDIPETPYITVLGPDGGENYTPGTNVNVHWEGYYEGNVSVKLYRGGSLVSTLATVTNGDQHYNWTVSSSLINASNYKIQVEAASSSVSDQSDADFSIEAPTLQLTSPDGGETYILGEQANVTWSTNMTSNIRIDLLNGSTRVATLTTLSADQGSYQWNIDSTLDEGSQYKIELVSLADTTLRVESSQNFNLTQLILLAQTHLSVDDFDSEHSSTRSADKTIDGDNSSLWHTEWSPGTPDFPHYITYAIDTTVSLAGFSYLPRQDGSANGRVKAYQIETSDDNGVTWDTIHSGTLTNTAGVSLVLFDQLAEVDMVRFKALSEQSDNFYASMAEFNLYYVDVEPTVSLASQSLEQVSDMITSLKSQELGLQISDEGNYRVTIVNAQGEVYHQGQHQLTPGQQSLQLQQRLNNSQRYFINVQGQGLTQTHSMTIFK